MVFSIQRYIEDYLNRLQIDDPDQYAVKVANLYDQSRPELSKDEFVIRMGRIRSSLFKRNRVKVRSEFESDLLDRLDATFKKKTSNDSTFPGGVQRETKRLSTTRRSIRQLLTEFKNAVESRGIDSFWESRRHSRLKSRPEAIAQGLLAVFGKGVLGNNGFVGRELLSGIGFVDIVIQFGKTPHLIELKILNGNLVGDEQLLTYMQSEKRNEGWLVLIDARAYDTRIEIPRKIAASAGTIHVILVDINPKAPSKKRGHR